MRRPRSTTRRVFPRRVFALALLVLGTSSTTTFAGVPAQPSGIGPRSQGPLDPSSMLRALGADAAKIVAPSTGVPSALFALPVGKSAESLGLFPVVDGFGQATGAAQIATFQAAHPEVRGEIGFPLHLLNNNIRTSARVDVARAAGLNGTGVIVGIADTGLDVTHPDFRQMDGSTRVLWLLDLSRPPTGLHPDLEAKFGIHGSDGSVIAGAVYNRAEIQQLLSAGVPPADDAGHGSHVASIAAGNNDTYGGVAPKADLVIVRVSGASDGIETDSLVKGVGFIFDRADAEKKPAVANLSLGTDFGPHNGALLWEKAVATYVGETKPGHVIVAAAGNSGGIGDLAVHQAVHVDRRSTVRVPVRTKGARSGSVQVWVQFHKGADLTVGLEGADGTTWISQKSLGEQGGTSIGGANAGVLTTGSGNTTIPEGNRAAVVVWSGSWPSGEYNIVLEGSGDAELNLQGTGDAGATSRTAAQFRDGVRAGTINSPAAHPSILGVGCTMNRAQWKSMAGTDVTLGVPDLDGPGGVLLGTKSRPQEGDICWFSSAGPNADGVPKPEIAAPGGIVVAAMSGQATPGNSRSIFTDSGCPRKADGTSDPACYQVDATHAVSLGTSMASPAVAGAAALLLQADPTLTQARITALLQAGAQRFRGAHPFDDQNGAGELDVAGAMAALERSRTPELALPAPGKSWFSLGNSFIPPDATDVPGLLELRAADGGPADLFALQRLQIALKVSGEAVRYVTPTRRAPGLYAFNVAAEAGEGGKTITVTPLFDGSPVAAPRVFPIGADGWRANYGVRAEGGCSTAPTPSVPASTMLDTLAAVAATFAAWRRRAKG